jgi:hypothetical protein
MLYAPSKSRLAVVVRELTGVGSRKSLQDWGASGAPVDKGPNGYDVTALTSWLFARAGNPDTDEPSWAAKRSRERFLKQRRLRIDAQAKLMPREFAESLAADLVTTLAKGLQKLEQTLPEAIVPDGDAEPVRIALRARTKRIRSEARKTLAKLCETPERLAQILEFVRERTGVDLEDSE